jgi:cystathionine beta-lyase/cystathionine gamma-synthase
MEKTNSHRDETLCVEPTHNDPHGAVAPPIYQTANFRFSSTEAVAAIARGEGDQYIYTRYTNPSIEATERRIARLEQGDRAFLFGSGAAALATWCRAFLHPGDRLVCATQLYGGTTQFLDQQLAPFGITIARVDFTDLAALARALPGATGCWFETPTNPTVRIVDGPAVADLCRTHRVLSAIDNTFATPINQKPHTWGIDWVMHSATKFFGGHSDLIAGVLVANDRIDSEPVYQARLIEGGVIDPHTAFLVDRGIKTLALRVERHNFNALTLARQLQTHAKVDCVHYPGLPDHPGHEIAARQMRGFGGVMSLDVKGGFDAAARFADALKLVINAASLGGVESLVSLPLLTSHIRASEEELRTAAITPGTVRLSVGIEAVEDLYADIDQALQQA